MFFNNLEEVKIYRCMREHASMGVIVSIKKYERVLKRQRRLAIDAAACDNTLDTANETHSNTLVAGF
jgi:hypothetical protein